MALPCENLALSCRSLPPVGPDLRAGRAAGWSMAGRPEVGPYRGAAPCKRMRSTMQWGGFRNRVDTARFPSADARRPSAVLPPSRPLPLVFCHASAFHSWPRHPPLGGGRGLSPSLCLAFVGFQGGPPGVSWEGPASSGPSPQGDSGTCLQHPIRAAATKRGPPRGERNGRGGGRCATVRGRRARNPWGGPRCGPSRCGRLQGCRGPSRAPSRC